MTSVLNVLTAPSPFSECPKGLPPTEERFVGEYVAHGNATRAYLRAHPGVTYDSAAVMASRLLRRVKIQRAIEAERERLREVSKISREQLVAEHSRIAFSQLPDAVSWDADGRVQVVPSCELDQDTAATIAEVRSVETTRYLPDGSEVRRVETTVRLCGKQASLEAIERMPAAWRGLHVRSVSLNPLIPSAQQSAADSPQLQDENARAAEARTNSAGLPVRRPYTGKGAGPISETADRSSAEPSALPDKMQALLAASRG